MEPTSGGGCGKRPASTGSPAEAPEVMRGEKGSSANSLRREAAKARLLAHNTDDEAERQKLGEMAAMLEREADAIDAALRERS